MELRDKKVIYKNATGELLNAHTVKVIKVFNSALIIINPFPTTAKYTHQPVAILAFYKIFILLKNIKIFKGNVSAHLDLGQRDDFKP